MQVQCDKCKRYYNVGTDFGPHDNCFPVMNSYHVAYKRTRDGIVHQDVIKNAPSVKRVVEIIETICLEPYEIVYIVKVTT